MAITWSRIARQLGQKESCDNPSTFERDTLKNLGRPKPNPPDAVDAERISAALNSAWDSAAVAELQKAYDAVN